MNIRNLETIVPLVRTMKKSIRRWWVVLVITILLFLLIPVVSNLLSSLGAGPDVKAAVATAVLANNANAGNGGNQSPPLEKLGSAGFFLLSLLVLIFLYFRNIKKNAELKKTIIEFRNITQIDVFIVPYNRLLLLSKIILPLDAISFILWPIVSLPIKFVFWINYRKIKRNFRKLRRRIAKGEKKYKVTNIYDDPFYSFLMREGLYKQKDSEDDFPVLESTDTESEKIESEDMKNEKK